MFTYLLSIKIIKRYYLLLLYYLLVYLLFCPTFPTKSKVHECRDFAPFVIPSDCECLVHSRSSINICLVNEGNSERVATCFAAMGKEVP